MFRPEQHCFAFTRKRGPDGRVALHGTSLRYGAISVLGDPAPGRTGAAGDLRQAAPPPSSPPDMLEQLDDSTNLGDLALVTWAAAELSLPQVDAGRRAAPAAQRRRAATPTPSRRPGCCRPWWRPAQRAGAGPAAGRAGSAAGGRLAAQRHLPALDEPARRRRGTAATSRASPTRSTRSRRWPAITRPSRTGRRWRWRARCGEQICRVPGPGRPVVVALRLPHRRGDRRLPGLHRPPGFDGADGAAGPGRGGRTAAMATPSAWAWTGWTAPSRSIAA